MSFKEKIGEGLWKVLLLTVSLVGLAMSHEEPLPEEKDAQPIWFWR